MYIQTSVHSSRVHPNKEFLYYRMNHAASLAAMSFNSKLMPHVSDLSHIEDSCLLECYEVLFRKQFPVVQRAVVPSKRHKLFMHTDTT